jgi:general secretion pathway protein H
MRTRRATGFTLLEMLIVVVIVGVVMGMVAVNAQPSPRTQLEHQAQRLILLLQTAHEEARLRSQPVVWEASLQQYRFVVRDNGRWQPLHDDVLRAGSWRSPLSSLHVAQPGMPDQGEAVQVMFGREAIEPSLTVTMERDGARVSIVTLGPGRYAVE